MNERRFEVFQEMKSGELFELVSFFDNSACFKRLSDSVYLAVSKPYFTEDDMITFRFNYPYSSKRKAIEAARIIDSTYKKYMNETENAKAKKERIVSSQTEKEIADKALISIEKVQKENKQPRRLHPVKNKGI